MYVDGSETAFDDAEGGSTERAIVARMEAMAMVLVVLHTAMFFSSPLSGP